MLAYHYATAWSSPRRPGKPTRPPSWKHPRCGSSGWPESAPSGWTPRRRCELRAGARAHPRGASRSRPQCWPASARPPSTPDASSRREDALEEAIAAFEATGDVRGAAAAMGTFSKVLRPVRGSARGGRFPPRRWRCSNRCRPARSSLPCSPRSPLWRPCKEETRPGFATPTRRSRWRSSLAWSHPPGLSDLADWAAAYLGDRGGLDDFREAITLATEAGQGSEAALLMNNLGVALWAFEGPRAALEVLERDHRVRAARGASLRGSTRLRQQAHSALRQRPVRRGARRSPSEQAEHRGRATTFGDLTWSWP